MKDFKTDYKLPTSLPYSTSSSSSSSTSSSSTISSSPISSSSLPSSVMYINNKLSDNTLKHSFYITDPNQNKNNTNNKDNNNSTTNYNTIERKLKTRLESFPKMYSIQENIDYEFGIKLPKMITNYHNKQTKYYLNLNYNKFYKKRKTFNLMNYTTYKPILNYSYNNEENDINKGNNKLSLQRSLVTSCTNTTITTTTANTTYNNNSNHNNNNNTNSTFYKRSDYGRFKRSKDCGPSLSDVPMNVDFNTLNPSCTSNRYHIFNFEQVKYLDEIMNSFISISPKPLYQNFLGTNNIISTSSSSSSSSSLKTTSLPTIISKPCSCFCTHDPIIYDFMKQTYTKHSDHLSSDCLINSTNFNNTENCDNIDKVISSSVPTTVPVSKGNNLVTSIPDGSSNSEINNTSNDNNINNAYQHLTNDSCLPNHHNTISHSPIPFTLQQPLKLPTIRTQLKKLIRTIRDGLLKESIPVKEIRLNGEVASSIIIGSENKQTFHDIELLFYVDLSNSTTCTKIKSVIYSCIENILKDTIILENLSNITNHCIFCYHSSLPLNISTIQTTQNPLSSSSLSYNCKYCSYYKLNPFNIPVHLNKENVENLNQQKINKNQLSNFYFPINQSFIHRQPLHENQFNTISYNNNNIIIKENPSKYSMLNNKQTINNNNNDYYYKLNHSLCHYHSLLSSIECPKCSTCSRLLNPFNQHSNINYNNNNNKSNNNNIIMIIKQYIQKIMRIYKPTNTTYDSWLLFIIGYHTINKSNEKIIKIKFIDRISREYEFTIDSFHIIINNLIKFYDLKKNKKNKKIKKINKNYYPIIVIKSVACSYIEALKHLNNNMIVIYKPEEIYGGGLLKYCKLLINGYKPCKMIDIKLMEKYMCSRFFIDFSNILSQYYQLNDFLMNYIENNYKIKIDYLNILYEVVSHSTICLMTHERQQTLCLIQMFLRDVTEQEKQNKQSVVHLQEFSSKDWALDKVFYGTNYFPKQLYSINDQHELYELYNPQCQFEFMNNSKDITDQQNSTISNSFQSNIDLKHVNKVENTSNVEDENNDNNDAQSHNNNNNDTDDNNNGHIQFTNESQIDVNYNNNNNYIEKSMENNHHLQKTVDNSIYIKKTMNDNENIQNISQIHNKMTYSNQKLLCMNNCALCNHHIHSQLCHNHPHQHDNNNYYYHNPYCYHYHHHHHSCQFNNELYYIPQIVTYFPANEYLFPSSTNKNQAFYSMPHSTIPDHNNDTTCNTTINTTTATSTITNNGNHPTINILSNKLPHYHAKILLPQDNSVEATNNGNIRYYVGVPCSYPSNIICSKYSSNNINNNVNNNNNNNNTVQTRDDILTYCGEPFIYYTPDQNYYIYSTPTSTITSSIQENIPIL
ncbi:unnamed protein product [Schistosoma guineensis]|nr:unnamed protein product [Schistosoma guineensis]